MNINLHIERLVLDGVDIASGQQPVLQAAVEAELARLLAVDGLSSPLAGGGALNRVAGPAIQLNAALNAVELGRQIAGSVHQGIGK